MELYIYVYCIIYLCVLIIIRFVIALLLLYDVTNKITFDNIRAWLVEIRDCAQDDVVIVLIGWFTQ